MDCTPAELIRLSRCWCLPASRQRAAMLYLACVWANAGGPPSPCTLPTAPIDMGASAGDGQVTLTWPAGVGATGYLIKRALVTGGPYTVIGTSASSPYVDLTAVNGTTYYYVVSSTNACGESSGNSIESHGTPVAATPGVLVLSNGVGGFCSLVVDILGNVGAVADPGPATSSVVLEDPSAGFWQLVTDSVCNRGTTSVAGPATVAPVLTDANSVDWTLIVDSTGNLGATNGTSPPNKAITPSPVNGGTSSITPTLSWVDGGGATSYDVWFNGTFIGNQVGLTYVPGALAFNTVYSWRIDSVNSGGTTTGDTWGFTTVAAFSYEPSTALISWTDINGSFGPVDRPTFLAAVDIASVTSVTLNDGTVTSLSNLSSLPALTGLACQQNLLTTLDVTGCTALTSIVCDHNALTTLDVSGHTALTSLICTENSLTTLDVTGCTALTILECDHNSLTTFDLTGCTALTGLNCGYNALPVLAVNTILSDLVTNGHVGGAASLDGQTPAASPSVGPPNGIVAKAALLAEAPPWTVTTD